MLLASNLGKHPTVVPNDYRYNGGGEEREARIHDLLHHKEEHELLDKAVLLVVTTDIGGYLRRQVGSRGWAMHACIRALFARWRGIQLI